ncbi:putative RING-H2 finger protein ATL69 [Lolium rigidum]|uniref:putative RING-H2 finger protein ATL69 n=1 Tax=Lolium rigidum TaxID=89674 RepID=UPI001F5CF62D|nr:putative RING-H2 finger protein ATL69 [Lolium rigidum]
MSAPRGSSMGMNVLTTAMAFSVSAFFVLFVFTRILCARIHLRNAAAQHAAAAQAGDVAIHVERSVHGMEPSVVTAFPTVKLGDDSQRPPAQEESHCTVCLEEYQAKDVVRVLPYCGHAFHVACIDAWLKQQSTCPICRASMRATTKHRAAAAAAATMPPVYYAVAMAQLPFRVSTSSSEQNALQAEAAVAATTGASTESDHVDMTPTRLEIVISDEPASSGAACPSATHAPDASEYPCCEMTRHSSQGNTSEHRQC